MASIAQATRTVFEPRVYQREAINAGRRDLAARKAALLVMPTGAGKSLTMGNIIDEEIGDEPEAIVLVLQHTEELMGQNIGTISSILAKRGCTISVVQGRKNSLDGQVIFGSTPTLARKKRREALPRVTHLVVDEGHRLGTHGAKLIVKHLRKMNPDLKILAVTATPNRSDGQTIAYAVGEGVSYQITYHELVEQNVLVMPRTFTLSLGLEAEIEALPKWAGDYDMDTVGLLMNRQVHNEAVVEHWLKHASDRQTIGFCTVVSHAQDLAQTFRDHGIVAEAIWGEMDKDLRQEVLERHKAGTIQVLLNCMVLTEGYDDPRVGCVMLLRPMLEELTFLQAVGRGARALDPITYPGETKNDFVILDFSGAAKRHGKLETRVIEEAEAQLRARNVAKAEQDNVIDMRPAKKKLRHFEMEEIELSSAPDMPLTMGNLVCSHAVAHNNYAWAGVFNLDGCWHAIAQGHGQPVKHLGHGERLDVILCVDNYLRRDPSGCMPKSIREAALTAEQKLELVRWMVNPMTIKDFYEAQCRLSVAKAQVEIRALLAEKQPTAFAQAAAKAARRAA